MRRRVSNHHHEKEHQGSKEATHFFAMLLYDYLLQRTEVCFMTCNGSLGIQAAAIFMKKTKEIERDKSSSRRRFVCQ
jgi:hypothetical protein